jgi:hypothetical protein
MIGSLITSWPLPLVNISVGMPFLPKIKVLAHLACAAANLARSSIGAEEASLEDELQSSEIF